MESDALAQGRAAFDRRVWGDAFAHLSAADRDDPLSAEDLERLAVAAYLLGRDTDCDGASATCACTLVGFWERAARRPLCVLARIRPAESR